MINSSDQSRKDELLALIKLGSVEQAVFDELFRINAAEASQMKARQDAISGVLNSISTLKVGFKEIHTAFSVAEIQDVAISLGLIKRNSRGVRPERAGVTMTKRTGAVLIRVTNASGFGAPATFHKAQPKQKFVAKAFKALYEANPSTFALDLPKYFTPEGEAYFSTPEGQSELSQFVEFVKNGRQLPQQGYRPRGTRKP
jgi:hypothetical protein